MIKIILFVLLNFVICTFAFSQTVETITYFDMLNNRNVTVKAIFAGWYQQYTTISDSGRQSARLLTYGCTKFSPEFAAVIGEVSEWSQFELVNTEPSPYAGVELFIQQRDAVRMFLRSYQNIGLRWGDDVIRILAAPSNRGEPIWFDSNNNLNTFYNIYIIVP